MKAILSMRVVEASTYTEKRNCIAYDYVAALEERGFLVLLVPNNSGHVRDYMREDDVGVVVLTGGNSVGGGSGSESTAGGDVYPERDRTERELLTLAMSKDIPVLGICRGAQFINVCMGGKMTRDIPNHVGTHHTLRSLRGILNGGIVNSFHRDAIDERDLADDLEPLAFSEDGYVEAFRHRTRRVVGILWHPERSSAQMAPGLLDEVLRAELGVTFIARRADQEKGQR